MKMPPKPPDFFGLIDQAVSEGPHALVKIHGATQGPFVDHKYPHWDKLRRLPPPADLTSEEWWLSLKMKRTSLLSNIPLSDKSGGSFRFLVAGPIQEWLHKIDQGAGGLIEMPPEITNPETKDRYYVNSLFEEAITSSMIEGAVVTREQARAMLRAGRPARDRSERMILNNYLTMKKIGELKNERLTPGLVFEIHRLITDQALDNPSAVGRFRRPTEKITVCDVDNTIFHIPPDASELPERMDKMCEFANSQEPFIHPVVRSIILHFWLAYDHPFIDGNGRTARALFYWSMLRHRYWLFEFISISQEIYNSKSQYYRSFLHTETDDNDLTYFVSYHLTVINRAITHLHEYIKAKSKALRRLTAKIRGVVTLNHRQRALLGHALQHPGHQYTVKSHQTSHNVAYQTARTDLLNLQERELLEGRKVGRTWHFLPASDIEQRLKKLQ